MQVIWTYLPGESLDQIQRLVYETSKNPQGVIPGIIQQTI